MCFKDWFAKLTNEEMSEFIRLEKGWYENEVPYSIIKDWIEEHGGKREWWKDIFFEEVLKDDARGAI